MNWAEAPADGKWSLLCSFNKHPAEAWLSLVGFDLILRLPSQPVHGSIHLCAMQQPLTAHTNLSPAFWNYNSDSAL